MLSISWYADFLLVHYRGTQRPLISSTARDIIPPWGEATIDEPSNSIYLKVRSGTALKNIVLIIYVVNLGKLAASLTANFDATYTSRNGTILLVPNNYIAYHHTTRNADDCRPMTMSSPSITGNIELWLCRYPWSSRVIRMTRLSNGEF